MLAAVSAPAQSAKLNGPNIAFVLIDDLSHWGNRVPSRPDYCLSEWYHRLEQDAGRHQPNRCIGRLLWLSRSVLLGWNPLEVACLAVVSLGC